MPSQPIEEWFSESFDDGQIPDEVVEAFTEELADTTDDLLGLKPEEIEETMESLTLKPKIKSKIRRAIKALEEKGEESAAAQTLNRTDQAEASAVTPERPAKTTSFAATPPTAPPHPLATAVSMVEDPYFAVAPPSATAPCACSTSHTPPTSVMEQDISFAFANPPSSHSVRQDVPQQPGTFIVPTVSKDEIHGPWKTILVVGETGCGKSTTLNSIVHHLWGFDIKDHFRFVLVPPPSSAAAQAHSVTSSVTAYHLRPPKLMYGVTIVDTPGFGDTKGLEADQEIVRKIEHAFKNEIDTLDGICFIVRSAPGRLDAHLKYVFNSVLRLFGNDVKQNLFTLVTFADGAVPPILAALDAAMIPSQETFELNNSAFFNGFEPDRAVPLLPHMCVRPGSPMPSFPVPRGILDRPHTGMFWKMGSDAMEKLFEVLSNTQPVSLKLSIGTLDLRKKLQHKIIHLQQQVSNGLNKISNMRSSIDSIKRHAKEINSSKNFVIKGKKNELYKKDTPGRNNTTCTNCKHTCHANCAFSKNEDKVQCIAMNGEYCTSCVGKCHWTAHINDPFVLKTRQVDTSVVRDEIKKKFDKNTADLSFAEQAVITISKDIAEEQQNVKISIDELREAIAELNQIALRPSVMEEEDYYDKLIQTEEAQRSPGWKDRVTALKELKDQSRTLKQVTDHDDAGVVIFQSAMNQVSKDLADIRAILGKGDVDQGAADKLRNVEQFVSKTTSAVPNRVPTKNSQVRYDPTTFFGSSTSWFK